MILHKTLICSTIELAELQDWEKKEGPSFFYCLRFSFEHLLCFSCALCFSIVTLQSMCVGRRLCRVYAEKRGPLSREKFI